jgi:uncharacterized protein YecT (DUF1311 family)
LIFTCYCSFSQSQADMNESAGKDFLKAEGELNRVYKQILTDYKPDIPFIKNLKTSQQLWLKYREAEIKMKFPEHEPGYYGSVYPMCLAIYKTQLTNERIEKLNHWLDGEEEGDVCSGSVKMKVNN